MLPPHTPFVPHHRFRQITGALQSPGSSLGPWEVLHIPAVLGFAPYAGQALYDRLSAGIRKEFKRFGEAEGAGGHCEGLGATIFEGYAFDWLDDVFSGWVNVSP